MLEGIWPPGVLILYPSLRIVEQVLAPPALGAEILLEAIDGVRQHREHKPFFGAQMTLCPKDSEKLMPA
jgi:hypothetical protein